MAKALVLYHSQEYGNTKVMAEAVAEGLRDGGCEVEMYNTNDGRYDMKLFPQYDCVAFGSPDYFSYIAGGLKIFMDDHYIYDMRKGLKGLRGKPYSLFCSHGGGGRVKDVMEHIFRRVGTVIGETVAARGTPDTQVIERCKALGNKLAGAVK